MTQLRRWTSLLVCLMSSAGCAGAHELDAGVDAGSDGGRVYLDLGDRGLAPGRWPEPCMEDEECPDDPPDLACFEGLCGLLYSSPVGWGEASLPECYLNDPDIGQLITWNGEPCAIRNRDGDILSGRAVPVELCVALGTAETQQYQGVFDGCVWSDGLPVTRRAEEVPCPWFNDGVDDINRSYCGGTCGTWGCIRGFADATCVGRSDDRSFGVCTYDANFCSAGQTFGLSGCSQLYGEPCRCMVLYPQNPLWDTLKGWNVAGSLCEEYQRLYPGSVECRDEEFEIVQ